MHEKTIKEAILLGVDESPDPGHVAKAVVAALRLLHTELSLVVGAVAAGALGAHAVHRTRSQVDWTMPPAASISESMLAALEEDLTRRSFAGSQDAGETLLAGLIDHLISLIGESLTYRIVYAAWGRQPPQPI